ncbi:hypothetical protein DTO169E5_7808 [Paecilomyces variotii]|nr:hypothetical protein DTO169E5_7808 [Paecilomyces variotii]KAJ9287141.1 hypothetical protein DTO021C3_5277 [Paecilomyces variotii]
MTDALYELLAPYLDAEDTSARPAAPQDATTSKYLHRLSTLSLQLLKDSEPQSLAQSSHSTLLSLQALSNRSHKAFITSSDNLSALRTSIPRVGREVHQLRDAIPKLDEEAVRFSSTYSKTVENPIIERRKKAMQLARNVDRLSDILELPTLLSTAVSSASASANSAAPSSTNYSSALDLYAHIKRLQTLYPDSPLVKDVALQAEDAMKDMTTNLISSLRSQNIRLAAAMRTVGWLRRVAPELEGLRKGGSTGASEGALGAIFLISRLANLVSTLEALDPLRELADQETRRRIQSKGNKSDPRSSGTTWSGGHQTERYLKRYIEIYREQTFAIVSLYKNIFTPEQSDSGFSVTTNVNLRVKSTPKKQSEKDDPLQVLPPALATLPMHLVTLLTETLRTYLPNVQDKSSRESLLTQVLYCAGSLGRLGGDFGMILTLLDDSEEGEERDLTYDWEEVMRKHRALAGRLEQLTGGSTGAGGKGISPIASPVH